MERIVYILGAGFSAPLGLPVMSNFLMKSKDLFFSNTDKYAHFESVFEDVQRMSYIKNFYDSDLFNLEEILSIMEMENLVSPKDSQSGFIRYISDVISSYTPEIVPFANNLPSNWYDFLFGKLQSNKYHSYFISELLGINYSINQEKKIIKEKRVNAVEQYSVITLNYDLVIENTVDCINTFGGTDIDIVKGIDVDGEINDKEFYLAKLHGCVSNGGIVPPTWKKNANPHIESTWILARKLLEQANQIRIIGYSLPRTDSYLKYLFKSSVLNSKHLKKIDVLNLETGMEIRQRFDDFIKFNYYNYKNANVHQYTSHICEQFRQKYANTQNIKSLKNRSVIELIHNDFMIR